MFRRTIRLNERADVHGETYRLREQALRAGLEPAAAEQLATAFGTTLGSLVEPRVAEGRLSEEGARK